MKKGLQVILLLFVACMVLFSCTRQEETAEMLTALPSFSSEDELLEYLTKNSLAYDISTCSDDEPDVFARPAHIPEGYSVFKITLSAGNEEAGHDPALEYLYYSDEFIKYNATTGPTDLNTSERDAEHQLRKTHNSYYFLRDCVPTISRTLNSQNSENWTLVESSLYPGVYYTNRGNVPGQKEYTRVVWFDEYDFICEIRMPYEMFKEEDIPVYTELEYFSLNTETGNVVMVNSDVTE